MSTARLSAVVVARIADLYPQKSGAHLLAVEVQESRTVLAEARNTILGLVDQQAMPDDFFSGYADFRKNGVNGGVNEAGIKRVRTLLKAAEKGGIPVMYQATCTNSIATLDEFLAGLG